MSLLLSLNKVEFTYGSRSLFEGLSFGVEEGQKIGLIGPNGAGKSTLLKIIAGDLMPHSGESNPRKNLRIAQVTQDLRLTTKDTAHEIVTKHLQNKLRLSAVDAEVRAATTLSIMGFVPMETPLDQLSGGWRKRVDIACAFAEEPDLLLLDEPTNHLDWNGILWLEDHLRSYKNAFILVSHDRTFLNSVTNKTMEINSLYREGFLSFDLPYEDFLKKKSEYIQAQIQQQEVLSNKANRELEWLRAGVKARTTKSQSRQKEAYALLSELEGVKERNRSVQSKSRVEIDASGRKTKKLFDIKNLNLGFSEKTLISDLNLILRPKTRWGILGDNGSGKTSLLRAITGELKSYTGKLDRAENLKIVYYDQNRQQLPQDISLIQFLGDGGEYLIFKDQEVHVASYARRFLFSSDKMQLKISQLSGGEQARLQIAKLLLQPADVLIFDEPTNDLDIETIEVLEDTLRQFEGLILLVSHDRKFLENLCDSFLGLTGKGPWATYSQLNQWLRERFSPPSSESSNKKSVSPPTKPNPEKPSSAKMSYKEKRQWETIEEDIQSAESHLSSLQAQIEDPDVLGDHLKLSEVTNQIAIQQKKIEQLYELWETLSQKA